MFGGFLCVILTFFVHLFIIIIIFNSIGFKCCKLVSGNSLSSIGMSLVCCVHSLKGSELAQLSIKTGMRGKQPALDNFQFYEGLCGVLF